MTTKTKTVTISMPENLRQFVENQVKTKGFGNVSEYFRALLREAQKREEQSRIDGLLLESLESAGKSTVSTTEFWQELRADIQERIRAKKAGG